MRLLIAVLVVFVIYSLQLKLYKKYWDRGLKVSLKFSKDIVCCKEKVELVEVIENNKPLALPVLNVKFATSRSFLFDDEEDSNVSDRYYRNDIFSILGYQKIERRLGFTTTARGIFKINELQISSKDLFLKYPFAHIEANDTELIVFPQRIPLKDYVEISNRIMGDYEINRWDTPDPFAFRGIRPYQSYDTMGSINWKASARVNDLMVNEYQQTTESEARIYLNLRPYMKSQAEYLAEFAISIVSTIAAEYISHGINVSFYTNGYDIDDNTAFLEAGSGNEHMKALDMILARLDISKKASDMIEVLNVGFSKPGEHVTHVLISTYRDDALFGFYSEHMNDKSMYWIVPERDGNEVELKYPGMFCFNV